jgi:CheY-like chemotaxis protein
MSTDAETPLKNAPSVMIFEDDRKQLEVFRRHCASLGLRPITVLCGRHSEEFTDSLPYDTLNVEAVQELIDRRKPDVILTDYDFGVLTEFAGTDVAKAVKAHAPDKPVILHSSFLDEFDPDDNPGFRLKIRAEALAAGADYAIGKHNPFMRDNTIVRATTLRKAFQNIGIDLAEPGECQER